MSGVVCPLGVACWLCITVVTGILAAAIGLARERPLDVPVNQEEGQRRIASAESANAPLMLGRGHLAFVGRQGYLRDVLRMLNVPTASQMLVFSKTSGQAALINPGNPRALFFNDSIAVGWVPGGFIEIAKYDSERGMSFYTLKNDLPTDQPVFVRRSSCGGCHGTYAKGRVSEMLLRSVFTAPDGNPIPWLGQHFPDQRSPFEERWGGWYVTGRQLSLHHMGNTVVTAMGEAGSATKAGVREQRREERVEAGKYPTPYSDIVALMVFDHQVRMANLLARLAWEANHSPGKQFLHDERAGSGDSSALVNAVAAVVDYLLFVDEAPLLTRVRGSSGFAERFSTLGPRDSKGRSLREFDLGRRLMRYPCSYMIYSQAFDDLPPAVRQAVYARMWQILSGKDADKKYRGLSPSDRRAVVGILRETKSDLPGYFRGPVQSACVRTGDSIW